MSINKLQEQLLAHFHDLLLQEFQALKTRQLLSLSELATQKTALLDQLTQAGLHKAPAQDSPDYAEWYQNVRPHLLACQRQNAINGKLIELNLISSRKLGTMLARIRDKESMTYNDHGLATPRSSMPLGIKA